MRTEKQEADRVSAMEQIRAGLLANRDGFIVGWRNWDQVQKLLFWTASTNGFHESQRNEAEAIALMHSEVSEAYEAEQSGAMDDKLKDVPGPVAEMSDVLIRVMDAAETGLLPLEFAIAVEATKWVNSSKPIGTLMDVHYGLSMALEADRAGDRDGRVAGYAYAVVAAQTYCAYNYPNYSLAKVLIDKALFNTTRPWKHGKAY